MTKQKICATVGPLVIMNSLCKHACGTWACTPGCSFACHQRGRSSAKTQRLAQCTL